MAGAFWFDTFAGAAGQPLATPKPTGPLGTATGTSHTSDSGHTYASIPDANTYPGALVSPANRARAWTKNVNEYGVQPANGNDYAIVVPSGRPIANAYCVTIAVRTVTDVGQTGWYLRLDPTLSTQSGEDGYLCRFRAGSGWEMFRIVAGAYSSILATVAGTGGFRASASDHTVRLAIADVSGNPVITLYVDGTNTLSYTDSTGPKVTRVGSAGYRPFNADSDIIGYHCKAMAGFEPASTSFASSYSGTTLTLSGSNTLWQSLAPYNDTAQGPFRVRSGGVTLSSYSVTSETAATAVLSGAPSGTLVLEDITTGEQSTATTVGGSQALAGTLSIPSPTVAGGLGQTQPLAGLVLVPSPTLAGGLGQAQALAGLVGIPSPTLAGNLLQPVAPNTLGGLVVAASPTVAGGLGLVLPLASSVLVAAPTIAGNLGGINPPSPVTGGLAIPSPTIAGGLGLGQTLAGSVLVAAPTLAGGLTIGGVTIPTTDVNWFFSPLVWVADTGGKNTALPHAYAKVGFSGTTAKLGLDLGALASISASAIQYPKLFYSVDHAPIQSAILTAGQTQLNLTPSPLAAGNHTLRFWLSSVDKAIASWAATYTTAGGLVVPGNTLRVTGLVLDASGSSLPYTEPDGTSGIYPTFSILLGDSVAKGSQTLGTGANTQTADDATLAWPVPAFLGMRREYAVFSYSAQGWSHAGFPGSGVPALWTSGNDASTAWNKVWAGRYLPGLSSAGGSFGGVPGLTLADVIVCHGDNDQAASAGGLTARVAGVLSAMRAAFGAGTRLYALKQSGSGQIVTTDSASIWATIKAATQALGDPNTIAIDLGPAVDYGLGTAAAAAGVATETSPDGDHLSERGHAWYAAAAARGITAQLAAAGSGGSNFTQG